MVNLGLVHSWSSVSVPEDEARDEASIPDSEETLPGSVSIGTSILGDFLIRFDEMMTDVGGKRGLLTNP